MFTVLKDPVFLFCKCFSVAAQTKFVPTTPRSSVSATSRTGVPEFSSHVRVVTSKSVVTSRPIPLGKHHPSYYSHKKEKKNKKHIVMGEAVFDVNGTNAIINNEIDVSKVCPIITARTF